MHPVFRAPALASLLLSLTACNSMAGHKSASSVKVTNGAQVGRAYPSVVEIYQPVTGPSGQRGRELCTATFVNDAQVVTAAHCVYALADAGTPAVMRFDVKYGGSVHSVFATDLVYHPGFVFDEHTLRPDDVAVVTFPAGSAPGTTALYPQEPAVGDQFTIVGFGKNDLVNESSNSAQVKRAGTNQIRAFGADGMIEFYGVPTATSDQEPLGQDSSSGPGDSGGPLLIAGALAGTTSGGGVEMVQDDNGQNVEVAVAKYVDLNAASNRDFLLQNLNSAPGW